MAEAVHILLVDDHPLFRRSLRSLLATQSQYAICGEVDSVEGALELSKTNSPDLILLDLSLKEGLGLEAIPALKQQLPGCKILVVSAFDENSFALRCLKAGASGYVEKGELPKTILFAIAQVTDGETYISPKLRELLLQPSTATGFATLSNKEVYILWLYGQGFSTREIAIKTQRSFKTIQAHRENIKEKLHLNDASELTIAAINWCNSLGTGF